MIQNLHFLHVWSSTNICWSKNPWKWQHRGESFKAANTKVISFFLNDFSWNRNFILTKMRFAFRFASKTIRFDLIVINCLGFIASLLAFDSNFPKELIIVISLQRTFHSYISKWSKQSMFSTMPRNFIRGKTVNSFNSCFFEWSPVQLIFVVLIRIWSSSTPVQSRNRAVTIAKNRKRFHNVPSTRLQWNRGVKATPIIMNKRTKDLFPKTQQKRCDCCCKRVKGTNFEVKFTILQQNYDHKPG